MALVVTRQEDEVKRREERNVEERNVEERNRRGEVGVMIFDLSNSLL